MTVDITLNGLQLSIRHFKWDDLPQVVELFNKRFLSIGDDERLSAEDIRKFYLMPDFNPETDVYVVTLKDAPDTLIATGELEFNKTPSRNWGEGAVDPAYENHGIGAYLIELTDAELLKRAAAHPAYAPDKPVAMERNCNSRSEINKALFEKCGYTYMRTFYRMVIDFDGEIAPYPMPEGIELRPFDLEQHEHAVYEAHQESFEDHWGAHRSPFDEWQHWLTRSHNFDGSMYQIAWDVARNEIAGVALNRPYGEESPELAWVGVLGVRKDWRKRGLGYALLRSSFHLFQQMGYRQARLGVDASSLTNAVALYERAGMRVLSSRVAYYKMLRGEPLALYKVN